MNIIEIRKAVKAEAQALFPNVKFSCRQVRSNTEFILELTYENGVNGELFMRHELYSVARKFEKSVPYDIIIDVFSVPAK